MAEISAFDKFGIESMKREEFDAKQAYVIGKCLCTTCPTYVKGDAPTGYCFPLVGTSKSIKWEKDCICEKCPIHAEYELTHTFYCTRCSQLCQAYKMEIGAGHE